MELLNNIFETVITVFEAFIIVRFNFSFHNYNYKAPRARAVYVGCSLFHAALVMVINQIAAFEGLFGVIYIAYLFIISLKLLEGTVLSKLFSSALSVVIVLFVTVIVSNLVSSVFKDEISSLYTTMSADRIISIILVQILVFAIYDIILKTVNRSSVSMQRKEWILISLIFGVSFVSIALIHTAILESELDFQISLFLLFAEIGLILIDVICFYMTYALSRYHHETEELKMMQQRYDFSVQYAENIKKQYAEMRLMRHDMRQNYTVIEGLVSQNQNASALDYIHERINGLARSEVFIDVGNDRINSIINSKLTQAKSNGIEVICSFGGDISGIDDADFCTLLGNMLDNAIDGCRESDTESRLIEMKIIGEQTMVRIRLSNTSGSSALENIKNHRTSKSDTESHGYGLKSIRYIAEKYHGSVNYAEDKDIIICQVIIHK